MALEEFQLITREDLNAIRLMPDSIDEDRLQSCIMEAQQLDLMPLLTEAFYWNLMQGFADYDDAFDKLLNGDEYEDDNGNPIKFLGLKRCLCYYAQARIASRNDQTYTSHSFVRKKSPYSEKLEPEEVGAEVSQLRSAASKHWNNTKHYLKEKEDTFPVWRDACGKKIPRGKIKIIAVG